MSKTPLGDLPVNTFDRQRNANLLLSPLKATKNENYLCSRLSPYRSSPYRLAKQQPTHQTQVSIGVSTDVTIPFVQTEDKQTMTEIVNDGMNMNEQLFDMCVAAVAPESYWKIVAEKRRLAIEETQNENAQLHELINELNKENEQLRGIAEQCQYLNQIVLELIPREGHENVDKSSITRKPTEEGKD
ncbi:unnamed protein product [Didymodactylos carnosus]|uniref:Geminin n=1 Tax=Didymodactylos carnosus TaxID=1234261 RepID=A0A813WR14_9BILA|nr:unnamed protein product [Didymodactylos carnosus]CAF1273374.1 unnamed protein product [Didymodactylos carnosus]CAF3645042.1 unnamed protein product [Didymodactylos carnosus]CAF4078669.1 unnamed protein product [Didymodactylos carnosus]